MRVFFRAKWVGMTVSWKILCKHPVPTLGYRNECENKSVVYCPDTDICDGAVELAEEADLLIVERPYLPGEEHSDWPHFNPESASRLALKSNVGKLSLVHFDASRYVSFEDQKRAKQTAMSILPETIVAMDEMELRVL